MKTPSPLIPQGVLPTRGRSHVPIIVSTILALHFVLLGALLIAGCKPTTTATAYNETTNNEYAALPAWVEPTNPNPIEATGPVESRSPARAEFVVPPPEPPPAVTPSPDQPAPAAPTRVIPTGVIPTPVNPPVTSSPTTQYHVVMKGDSFYSLAKHYGLTPSALAAANPSVQPTRLQIGDKLVIPEPIAAAPVTTQPLVSEGGDVYVVRSGDSLYKIAKNHNTTVDKLRSENNLRSDRIRVGDKLRLPER